MIPSVWSSQKVVRHLENQDKSTRSSEQPRYSKTVKVMRINVKDNQKTIYELWLTRDLRG